VYGERDLRVLDYSDLHEMLKEEDKSVLIIDFYFSFKMLAGNREISDVYVSDLIKIIDSTKINRVEFIMDENLYLSFKSDFIDPIKDYCKKRGISGFVAEVPSKQIFDTNQQRADAVIASRIGFYFPLVDNIFLFTGDADFIPVVRYLVKYSKNILSSFSLWEKICKNIFILYSNQGKYKTEFLDFFGGKTEIESVKNSCYLLNISSLTGRVYGELEDHWD